MIARTRLNTILGVVTLFGATPLLARTDGNDEGCLSQCDSGAVCCSTAGTHVCCSYVVYYCCHSNSSSCWADLC